VRERAAVVSARGRRLFEKAALLRQGAASAATAGDAAAVAALQRDRQLVQRALTAVLRRVRASAARRRVRAAAVCERARRRFGLAVCLRLGGVLAACHVCDATRCGAQLEVYRAFSVKLEASLALQTEAAPAAPPTEADPATAPPAATAGPPPAQE
jgi:hypothetical protein